MGATNAERRDPSPPVALTLRNIYNPGQRIEYSKRRIETGSERCIWIRMIRQEEDCCAP